MTEQRVLARIRIPRDSDLARDLIAFMDRYSTSFKLESGIEVEQPPLGALEERAMLAELQDLFERAGVSVADAVARAASGLDEPKLIMPSLMQPEVLGPILLGILGSDLAGEMDPSARTRYGNIAQDMVRRFGHDDPRGK